MTNYHAYQHIKTQAGLQVPSASQISLPHLESMMDSWLCSALFTANPTLKLPSAQEFPSPQLVTLLFWLNDLLLLSFAHSFSSPLILLPFSISLCLVPVLVFWPCSVYYFLSLLWAFPDATRGSFPNMYNKNISLNHTMELYCKLMHLLHKKFQVRSSKHIKLSMPLMTAFRRRQDSFKAQVASLVCTEDLETHQKSNNKNNLLKL